jgi:hypothetical protein
MNSNKFVARSAAIAALIAGVSSQAAAEGTCPVHPVCLPGHDNPHLVELPPVSDTFGPDIVPFAPAPELTVPQFDPAPYALQHGVPEDQIELVAVELRLVNTLDDATVDILNKNDANCRVDFWTYDLVAQLNANLAVGSPDVLVQVSVGESFNEPEYALCGNPGGDPACARYLWQLPNPVSESDCISWRIQEDDLSAWIGTGNITWDTTSAAVDNDLTTCGFVQKVYWNQVIMSVEVTYFYCWWDPDGGGGGACECIEPSEHYREPGSLLLFPEYNNIDGITVLTVTNTDCLDTAGNDVEIHFVYVDADGCTEFDKAEILTPCDTFTALTNFHGPANSQGYFYVYARDPDTHEPIVWNHLIGNLMVISSLEAFDYGMNPVSFLGIGQDGDPTDVDNDGHRDLNDVEYAGAPDVLTIPRFLGQDFNGGPGTIHSEMILIALSGGKKFTTTACFLYYNDNEEEFSGEYEFDCWDKPELLDMSYGFENDWLHSLISNDPDEILGAEWQEAGWICIYGCLAESDLETIQWPSIYAVLVERIGNWGVADLPFECGKRINGSLLPDHLLGDGDGPGNPPQDGDEK